MVPNLKHVYNAFLFGGEINLSYPTLIAYIYMDCPNMGKSEPSII